MMKRIATIFLITGLALLAVTSISAQDAAAPFNRNAFPTPTPTPSPKPKPAPTPTAPPAPSPTPAAQPKISPTPNPVSTPKEKSERRVLREKPVRAVEPRKPFFRRIPAEKKSGPPAYRPTIDLSSSNWATNSTLRSMENKWQRAVKNHDTAALDQLLDPDFRGESLSGRSASKAKIVSVLKKDKSVYHSAKVRDISVRLDKPRTAVVTGIAIESGRKADGTKFTSSRRFTDTWKQRKSGWRCVASKVSPIEKR